MVQRSKIYKILEITAEQFMRSGISGSLYSADSGLFYSAAHVDPFNIPGVLTGGYTPAQIGAAVVVDTIKYFCSSLGAGGNGVYSFGYGDTGKMYRINLFDDTVALLATVATSVGNGLELYNAAVYYSRNGYLGKMTNIEGTTPTFNDTFGTFTNSIAEHPLHKFAGKLYCGDGDHLDMNDGTTHSDNVLDIPSEYKIIDIDDDGYYLVIVAVKRPDTGNLNRTSTKIYFWNAISPYTWNMEWEINDGEITGISHIGERQMMAFTNAGIYSFTVSSAPKPFIETGGTGAPFTSNDFQPFAGAIQSWRGCLSWASNGKIFTYGKVLYNLPKIITTPVSLADIKSFFVGSSSYNWLYASTTENKLYKISTGSFGGVFQTGYIDLKRPWLIKRVKLYLQDTLASANGSMVEVQLIGDNGEATFQKFFSSDGYSDNPAYGTTKRSFWADGEEIATRIRVYVDMTGYNTFRKLEIYGYPLSNEITI